MSVQTTQGERINRPVVEGKLRVYYEDGTAHDCWPVDAREMVETGRYSWEPLEVSNDKRNVVDEDSTDSEAEEAEEAVEKPKRTRKAK